MAIFIDTSHILALINTSDEYHECASTIASEIVGRFVITEAVLTEIGNTLSRLRWRSAAVAAIEDLRSDPDIEVVSISPELFDRAVKLYSSRMDKEWGITDCASFIVMQDMGIIDALTTDDHFRQAGFRALLIE
ncbi:MAG: tRNA(fMet)-specific endonuclease VapC [Candidatus Methanogaster sp.]|nr:MAG: tRNA(fMet)-specific endonuclease VapC [ANME-2 cluster archaeon]